MRATYHVVVGDRGRLVLPAELRVAGSYDRGSELTLIDTGAGLVLLTREQLLERVREDLAGTGDLVAELIEERRAAAAEQLPIEPGAEDAA